MPTVTAQKVPKKQSSQSDLLDGLALFCYKFPQYTFAEARKMPYKRILHMLKVAKKEDARTMLELVRIVAAPHSKKGKMVQEMIQYYKGIIEG